MSTLSSAGSAVPESLEVQPFPYADAERGAASGARSEHGELAMREQAARELGRQEGRAEAETRFREELARIPAAISETLAAFTRERESFYRKIEPQIVSLALSIARKVLHRESQIDPLLLAGMVRVAMESIERSTRISLRVHPSLIPSWRTYFAEHLEPGELPEFVEDPNLDERRCVLETQVGKTELGWEVQFKEVEQGLLDLLAQSPKGAE